MKTHQGVKKRIKITGAKKKKKIVHESQGRGSKHLRTKKDNALKRRNKKPTISQVIQEIKELIPYKF